MSTHNICIPQEVRKILCGYPLLSVAIQSTIFPHIICLQDEEKNVMSYVNSSPDLPEHTHSLIHAFTKS